LAVTVATLLAGVAVSSGFALLATHEADQARQNADQAKQNAERAEQERTRALTALTAEQRAREASLDLLGRAYFEQARALRVSEQLGRRFRGLELLKQTQQLRLRDRGGVPP